MTHRGHLIGLTITTAAALGPAVGAVRPTDRPPDRTTERIHVDRARGLSVLLPHGWHLAPASLTPHLSDPHEVIALGTGPLTPGGPCAYVPTRAVLGSGPRGAFITLQERTSSGYRFRLRDYPARPRRWALRPSAAARPYFGCVGPGPVRVWWRAFRESGRAFNLLVAVGTRAPVRIRREARAVVNSLRLTPGRTVGGGPWIRVPPGWHSLSYARSGAQVLRASTAALPPTDIHDDDGATSQAALGSQDILVSLVRFFGPRSGVRAFPRARLPLRFARSDFPANRYEGQAAALAVRWVVVHGRLLRVLLALGPGDRPGVSIPAEQRLPSDADALIARADAVLGTLVLAAQ